MTKIITRAVFAALLASLAALSPAAAAVVIPAGIDYWQTPGTGGTVFEFPEGDVESLCHLPPSDAWNHQVTLEGIPTVGSDWDTAVARLDDAVFDATGNATVRIRVKAVNFKSTFPHLTPCGQLHWVVSLACCPQPITRMRLRLDPAGDSSSGLFWADLTVSVELKAYDSRGAYVGSLFYNRELPDPTQGTPWSYKGGVFRPGMDKDDNCIDVLRQKLSQTPTTSRHHYYISNMIAQGLCKERTAAAK